MIQMLINPLPSLILAKHYHSCLLYAHLHLLPNTQGHKVYFLITEPTLSSLSAPGTLPLPAHCFL